MSHWLNQIKVRVSLGEVQANAVAWLPQTGNAEIQFDKPVSVLAESDLIELLKACRVARKSYKAAMFPDVTD